MKHHVILSIKVPKHLHLLKLRDCNVQANPRNAFGESEVDNKWAQFKRTISSATLEFSFLISDIDNVRTSLIKTIDSSISALKIK